MCVAAFDGQIAESVLDVGFDPSPCHAIRCDAQGTHGYIELSHGSISMIRFYDSVGSVILKIAADACEWTPFGFGVLDRQAELNAHCPVSFFFTGVTTVESRCSIC